VAGAIAIMILGFNWFGWMLGGTAEKMANQRAENAIVVALTPICVEKFQHQAGAVEKLAEFKKISSSWDRRSLIESCRADGFIEKVFFPGYRHDLQRVLVSFDVAVQCSLTEGLGGTVEALLMERPTVASRVGGMPEAVRHEETGLLVPPADPSALAAAIERLLADRGEAQRLGRAGRALMLERFTLARTGSDLASLYSRVAGAGR
jgi:glycosyltransferase involved in cell wall biosynthesis